MFDAKRGTYKKFVIKDGKLVGLIMVGTAKDVHTYARIIRKGVTITSVRDKLPDKDFNPATLLLH